jgi:aminoglycoside/choline kinase family phosphotransferase
LSELEIRIETLTRSATRREVTRVEAIAAGLGAHRFFRVHCEGGLRGIARVLGVGAAGSGPEPPLEPVRALREGAGLPVPDVGSQSLADVAASGADNDLRALYVEACALLPRLQLLSAPASAPSAFTRKWVDFLPLKRSRALSVSLPAWLGREARKSERECLDAGFDVVEREMRDAPMRFAHRDFQSSNLMVRARHPSPLVMIDLQGAFLAPPEYDLMCLLRDSYVRLPELWVQELSETTRRALPDAPDPVRFRRRFDLLCIARKAKDDAFFLEAAERGDQRYAAYRAANRRYLADASRRLAQSFPCFEAWLGWFANTAPGSGELACAR